MRVLMVNKFLYPKGGSETYMLNLGEALTRLGHQVEYFGMEHEERCVSNSANVYTARLDFHGGSALERLGYPLRVIYSTEARKKLRRALDSFRPDVVHLNNFNYQLTPSVILEARLYERESGRRVALVYTAHDYQLICPNHLLYNPQTGAVCEACLNGAYQNCLKNACVHGSRARSAVGAAEAAYWRLRRVYAQLDAVVCPSRFMKSKLDANPLLAPKTVALYNFIDPPARVAQPKGDYALYFGRLAPEKGVETLIKACAALPDIRFVFAGEGELRGALSACPNIRSVGFVTGEALTRLIAGARFSICPSEWYENCPYSVMESQALGTPVVGAAIGGIPELIESGKTGELFAPGSAARLQEAIASLWNAPERQAAYARACAEKRFDDAARYCEKLLEIYRKAGIGHEQIRA